MRTPLRRSLAGSKFPFIKLITPDNMVGFSEAQKVQAISKVFADSSKCPMSVVIVDNIEHLLAVEIFRSTRDRMHALGMLRQAGLAGHEDRLSIGIKCLFSVIKMTRQDPEAVAKHLMSSLMGVGT
ncbi:hypothetical protein EDB83DRAFT_2520186 [Lactarius deliciosus]|nr:hypothetical protein EDB83DRAFT_2520186 [Lactarius deliciosus]